MAFSTANASRPIMVVAIAGVATTLVLLLLFLASSGPATRLPRVAHAGGEIQGQTYTNSIEALEVRANERFR